MDIQQLKSLKILVIGDSCEDVYHFGDVKRLSPEAPVPVFNLLYSRSHPGMAANVKTNLVALGASVDFVTNVEKIYKERYINTSTRQHMLRVDKGESAPTTPLSAASLPTLGQYDAVVISDYNKGFVSDEVARHIINSFQGPVFVDSKKKDLSVYEGCVIKINESERATVESLPKHCEMVVTLGPDGALWNDEVYPTESVEVFDVCGAGDTFFSALACAYLLTKKIDLAIKFANRCANISVQRLGTYAPTLEEIK